MCTLCTYIILCLHSTYLILSSSIYVYRCTVYLCTDCAACTVLCFHIMCCWESCDVDVVSCRNVVGEETGREGFSNLSENALRTLHGSSQSSSESVSVHHLLCTVRVCNYGVNDMYVLKLGMIIDYCIGFRPISDN